MQQPSMPKTVSNILAAISPLLVHGASCGQDLGFHIVSWLDAAQQLRQGHYPHWAITPAWNAGEPRFMFYPPLSWLLGAGLTMLMSANAAPTVFIFLVLVAAALNMYRLTRHFVSHEAALLAGAFYIGNPYMLFNAFERSAMAELMASVWIPLLLLAILRERPTARGIAIPLALLWLTNAPAAVMGSYMLALVATLRVADRLLRSRRSKRIPLHDHVRFASTFITGTVLGLALPSFYLVPAAYERRYVQVAMAIIPNMRFQDNFLFDRTADAAHNAVNHTASVLALIVLALAVIVISGLALRSSKPLDRDASNRPLPIATLAAITCLIAYLLVPISTPLWMRLPELAFLQFPWRLLSVLSVVLALALALLLGTIHLRRWVTLAAPLLTLVLSTTAYAFYAQHCEVSDRPATIATLLQSHHGVPPTDEYTPNNADNDVLRTGNPGYWFAATPNAPAPHTIPTAAELNPAIGSDGTPVPTEQTISALAPHRFTFHADRPGFLILNLRDYPSWSVHTTNPNSMERYDAAQVPRDDGLIAVQLNYASDYDIEIEWRRAPQTLIGIAISVFALVGLLFSPILVRRSLRPANPPLA
jgi:hypothetical protein